MKPTKEQILAEPAGRQMDAWVAEIVFGRDPGIARHGLHENGDLEYYWGYPVGHDIADYYSTSIAAAWKVVGELQQKPKELWFKVERTPCMSEKWHACLGVKHAAADTVPLAICRAALLAVLVDG